MLVSSQRILGSLGCACWLPSGIPKPDLITVFYFFLEGFIQCFEHQLAHPFARLTIHAQLGPRLRARYSVDMRVIVVILPAAGEISVSRERQQDHEHRDKNGDPSKVMWNS